ncbi:Cna B-type domain-containing protein [Arcanobacterium haemolyticum]|nr:Cna B-type domain-containing protein [Arcanobacterium haemolyticum]
MVYVSEITRFGTGEESSTMPFTYTYEDTGSYPEEKGELVGAWEDKGRTREKKPFTAQQYAYLPAPFRNIARNNWEDVFWSDGAAKTTLRTWQGIDENFADGREEIYLDFGGRYHNQISDRDTTGMKRNYMLMRYPVSLIDQAKARGVDMTTEGITVHNSVRMVQTPWNKNEAERYVVDVEAAANIVTTEVGKYDYDKDWRTDHLVRPPDGGGNAYGAQTAILAGKEAPMQSGGNSWGWQSNPSFDHWATSRASNPVWDKENQTYSAGTRTMNIVEGDKYLSTPNGRNSVPNTVPSSQNALNNPLSLGAEDVHIARISVAIEEYDAKYASAGVWEKDTSISQDFSRYKPVYIYAKMKGEPGYKLILTATRTRSNQYRYEYADGTEVYKDGNLSSKVDLPEGVVSLRYSHETDFFASSIRVQPQEILQPTDQVKKYVQKNVDDKQNTLYSHPATYYLQPEGGTKIDLTQDEISAEPKDGTSEKAISFVSHNLSQITRNSSTYMWTSAVEDRPETTDQKATISLVSENRMGATGDGMNLHAKYADDADIMGKYAFKSGEFYALIPAGVKVDLDSLHAGRLYYSSVKESNKTPGTGLRDRFQAIDPSFYEVETIPNYEDSGMTLLKVAIKGLPEEDQPYPNSLYGSYDRPMFRLYAQFDVINSYGNIRDRGAELVQTAAFVDTDENSEWNPGTPNFDDANNPAAYQYYKPLADALRDDAGNTDHFGMAQRKLTFKPISIAEAGTEEQVRNVDRGEDWGASADGLVNHLYTSTNYQYRLAYYQEKAAKGTGVVFYDVLDQAMKPDTPASQWQGSFQGVDLSAIEGKISAGKSAAKDYAKPVLYYATSVPSEMDVDDDTVWTVYPEDDSTLDKSTVKAIAIDVRKTKGGDDFVVPEASTLVAYVNMATPSDDSLDGKTATNEHLVKVKNFTGNAPVTDAMVSDLYAAAQITLHKVDVELTKSSDPATGTQVTPAEVTNVAGTPIAYTLTVENKDDVLALTDLILEDTIPTGLSINAEGITVSSSLQNAAPVDARVKRTIEGQKVTWEIGEMPLGEKLTFTIPTTLSKKFDGLQRFENTAYLTQVNGIDAEISSATMYHQTQPLITVSGTKTWSDADNQDGKRPEQIKVTLLADGVKTDKTATVKAGSDGKWVYSFTDMKTYSNDGAKIIYTVEEDSVTGYTPTYDGMNVTNTHTPEKTSIGVSKVWEDAENQDGVRPDSVTVKLLADGKDAGKAVLLNDGNQWKGTFSDLDKYAAGKEISYTVEEAGVTDGKFTATKDGRSGIYSVAVSGDAASGFVVTNSHTPETVSVPVSKVWVDNDDAKGLRPDSVTVTLLAGGVPVKGKTLDLTAGENWAGSFTDLPKFKAGQEIAYTISEAPVENYTASYGGIAVDGLTVTNTIMGKVSVDVTKVWSGIDADTAPGVVVELLADGVKVSEARLDGNAEGGSWSHTFADLDQYKGGKEIVYTVVEQGVQDGKLSAGGHDYTVGVVKAEGSNSWTVTNTLDNPETSVSGQKVWDDAEDQDGIRPESIVVELLGNDEPTGKYVEVSSDGEGVFEFTGLPTFDSKGKEITYSVDEVVVPDGYEKAVTGDATEGFTITNKHESAVVSVPVSKVWVDAEDKDGIRPGSVTFKLLADGEDTGKTLTVDAQREWKGVFEGLAKFKAGKEIVYTISEVPVEGYTSEVTGNAADGFVVTNTHEPKVVVKKKLPLTGANVVSLGALAMAVLVGGVVILRRREEA